jgi:hypothetical protein
MHTPCQGTDDPRGASAPQTLAPDDANDLADLASALAALL